MASYIRSLLIGILISTALPQNAFAIGDTLSGISASTEEFAKGVGKTVGIGEQASEVERDATAAFNNLVQNSATAAKLAENAKAILIFPRIVKAGLGFGGQYGNGVLREQGKTVGYYNTVAGSYGLQIGVQTFGYAMFFMDDKGLNYLLSNNAGWEIGIGPSVVFVDAGLAKTMNNTTMTESVYVITFDQKGLMAGAGIQGSKITKIDL